MTLKTTQMRAYVRTQLLGNTLAGSNVFDSRLLEIAEQEIPCINIWTMDEGQDETVDGYSQFHKTYSAEIEIVAMVSPGENDNPGVLIDTVREQIRARIDRHLGGLVECCEYDSTKLFVDVDSETPKVIAAITYNVLFTEN